MIESSPPAPSPAPAPPPAPAPSPWRRRLVRGALALAAGAALLVVALLARLAPIGAAYQAKLLCAGAFVAGRDPARVLAEDLAPDEVSPLLRLVTTELDREGRRVRASFLGLVEREAVFRPGLGTTVVVGPLAPVAAPPPIPPPDPSALWPEGERVEPLPPEVGALDRARLEAALDEAFAEPDPARPRRTRAVVVAWRGRLVAERYAPGFDRDTPQLGWSMTKTVVAALVGVLVRDGRWALDRPVPVREWGPGDPRAEITLLDLLQMQSGLAFSEVYSPLTDVTRMLFEAPDAGAYAADQPLAHPPGTVWSYSSGTTNVLCRAMREALGADHARFPRDALFAPLGMRSARIEVDASGTFVGSSFGWATARDWARFGLLWVQDGVWAGRRLLPAGWVARCRAPAPASGGRYGAHVWLRLGGAGAPAPALPADTFHAAGHDRQLLTMIPSRGLVVVRLGLTRQPGAWDQERFVSQVLAALPPG